MAFCFALFQTAQAVSPPPDGGYPGGNTAEGQNALFSLTAGNVNTTEQGPADGVAFVTVRLSDGRLGHQPKVMRSASSELQKTVDELQATVTQLTWQLKEQAAQIQKVTAQLEASNPAPQVVNNP